MTDYKEAILDNLKAMKSIELKNKARFKAMAYDKVIKQVAALEKPITSIDDLNDVKGIGESIKEKLLTIFEKGFLNAAVPELENAEKEKAIEGLTQIMAVGAVKARELVEKHGIMTIEQLRERATDLLNDKQQLGLKYHEDFVKRIPYKEMQRHEEFITAAMPDEFRFVIAGSYRRRMLSSGDIDVLVTSKATLPDSDTQEKFKSVIAALKAKKYLVDDFGFGKEKYLGVSRLPRFRTYRRIDIMYIAPEKFAFALLYFTGSQAFNIAMRNKALEKGYSLSEHGFKYTKGQSKGEFVKDTVFVEEEDIFKFLEMDYVEPHKRIA